MNLRRPFDLVRIALLCTSVLFGLTACGDDDPSTPDACAGVECEFGVCDGGECVNAASCEDGEDRCLQGYSCVDDTCAADLACPDGVCARGVCQAGACINPPVCQTGQNCLDGFFCGDEGTCEADPCSETTCDRGVCEIGTGECVNQDFCTSATEDDVCLDGFRCLEGACQNEEAVCNDLDCQRGVCSFEDVACIDADNCGNDMECLAGNYCADDNTCQPNLCDANGDCARGVCDPSSGECVDADTCSSETDCVDGVVCISGECTANEEACGVDGCQGNQNCAYDDSTLSATCEESGEGCSQALDCLDDRICNAGACEEPVACEDDRFEPNDADGEETDYSDVNGGLPVDANICGGDVDRFAFDTTEDPDGTGELIFSVDIANSDVGLGTLSLELFDTTGASVGTAVTQDAMGNPTGSASVTVTIDALNGGVFTGVVSDDGDVSTAGVNYSVRFDVVSADAIAACASPTELTAGTPATGNSANGASSGLVTSCGDADGTAPEDVWSFTLAEESLVNLVIAPLSNDPDLTVAIRDVCSQEQSEIECADEGGSGGNEAIEMILGAGTYYAVVQGDTAGDGGAYAITLDATPTVCSEGAQQCLDSNDLEFCNDTRTGFDTRTCLNGCDEDNDVCIPDAGDTCGNAFQVDINNPFNQALDRSRYQNTYDPGEGACVPDNTGSEATNGPDMVLEATVPDGHVLVVDVEAVDADDTSIYIVSDCDDLANTCLAGVNEEGTTSFNDELLAWENDTGQEVTVFAIVDSRDQTSLGTPRIEAFVSPAVCTPNSQRCVLDRESQLCNEFGTGYDETTVCEFGCVDTPGDPNEGACVAPENQTCTNATELTSGVINDGNDLAPYTSDNPDDTPCSQGLSGSKDAVYVVRNLQAGDTLQVDVDATFDSVFWIARDCDATSDLLDVCVDDVDSNFSSGLETLTIGITEPDDYYVVVKPWSSNTTTGSFSVEATVTPPVCTPGAVLGCNTDNDAIEICDATGQIEELDCDGGCTDAGGTPECGNPAGGSCFDALPVDTSSGTGEVSGDFEGSNSIEVTSGRYGECYVRSTLDEGDTVYSFDLNPGELLELDLESSASSGTVNILTDCTDFDTCTGNLGQTGGEVLVSYFAETSETVYAVVDAATAGSSDFFNLDWTVSTGVSCVPDSTSCIDSTTTRACSSDGTTFVDTICTNGCTSGACVPDDPTLGASCDTPATLSPDTSYFFDNNEDNGATDEFDSSISCLPGSPFGQDYFFTVTVPDQEVLSVTAEAFNPTDRTDVYIIEDCDDIAGTCVAGDRSSAGNGVTVRHQAQGSETLTVVVDSNSGADEDGIVFSYRISPPECTAGQTQCNMSGDAVEFCDGGLFSEVSCSSGVCSMGTCETPNGDSCFEPLPVDITAGTGTVNGNYGDFTSLYEPPSGCLSSSSYATNAEAFYSFELPANSLLSVSADSQGLDSLYWTSVYIIDECSNDPDFCAGDGGSSRPHEAEFFATTPQTVFVGVDRETFGSFPDNQDFQLSWEVQTGFACLPGATICDDAQTLSLCNSSGTQESLVTCAHGCDPDGDIGAACASNPVTDDTCQDATMISASTTIGGNFGDYTPTQSPSGSECNGSFFSSTNGPDAFFRVDLKAGDLLNLGLTSAATLRDPQLYLFTDCSDVAASCFAGNGVNDGTAQLEYFADFDEVVYVGVDTQSTFADTDWLLEVEILVSDCDPDTYVQTCNADDNGFEYCDERGFTQEYLCADDGACTNGRCDDPVGDSCIDPFDGNPTTPGTPEIITNTLDDFTDVNDLGTGNACTGSRTIGPDAVYAVDLTAGETLTVTAVSDESEPEDIAIYAATGPCGEPVRDVCVAGSDVIGADSMDESFNYTATADETIYVYVDSFYAGTEGDYTLTIDVSSP